MLAMPSNLLAHHLRVPGGCRAGHEAPLRGRPPPQLPAARPRRARRSRQARRRQAARRVLFVCTANSARSHLAAALWRQASRLPAASAGTHPADAIDPGAIDAALRRQLPLPRRRPRHISGVRRTATWSSRSATWPTRNSAGSRRCTGRSPTRPAGDPAGFDAALDELGRRVRQLAPRLAARTPLPERPADKPPSPDAQLPAAHRLARARSPARRTPGSGASRRTKDRDGASGWRPPLRPWPPLRVPGPCRRARRLRPRRRRGRRTWPGSSR